MAVVTVSGNPVVGTKYTVTTASSADWASVSNSTYFFDLTDKLVHYKDSTGTVLEIFGTGGGVNIYNADGTLTADRTVSGDAKILTFDNVRREVHNVVPNFNDATGFIINVDAGALSPFLTSRMFRIVDTTTTTEKFGINVNGNVVINNAYTLPLTDGSNGQVLKTNGFGDVTWGIAAGLTYFTEAQNTSAPNATVPVDSLTAVASTTNADFAIVSKGTGALTRHIPDGTATGGNKRGAGAVDLSTIRAVEAQVASGAYSFIGGGAYNRAQGAYSIAMGTTCAAWTESAVAIGSSATANGTGVAVAIGNTVTASGENSFANGFTSTASGFGSIAMGRTALSSNTYSVALGTFTIADGVSSVAINNGAHTFGITGRIVFSSTQLGVRGDAQSSKLILRKPTTNNTPTVLSSDSGVASAINQLTLQNNNSIRFKGTIIGRQSGSTNTSAWDIDGIIQRGTSAATTTLLVSNVNVVQNTPAWGTPTLTANTTLGCLTVSVIGVLTTNIQWVCVIDTTEVIYA